MDLAPLPEITDLLRAADAGDVAAAQRVFQLAYDDLKRLARARLHNNHARFELDTTSLVHEAFMRVQAGRALHVEDRRRFFAYIGRVMRSVLVDFVREQHALKRGGAARPVTLTTGVHGESFEADQLLLLDSALTKLERLAPALHHIVELRYFVGLTLEEIGEQLDASPRTVSREWAKARVLLLKLMGEETSETS